MAPIPPLPMQERILYRPANGMDSASPALSVRCFFSGRLPEFLKSNWSASSGYQLAPRTVIYPPDSAVARAAVKLRRREITALAGAAQQLAAASLVHSQPL